jgi:hypothetical protein
MCPEWRARFHGELLEQRSDREQDGGCHDSDAYREADDRRNELNESGAWFHNLYHLIKHL